MPQNKDFVVRNGFQAAGGALAANSSSFSCSVGATFGAAASFGNTASFSGAGQFNNGLTVQNGITADTISVGGLTVNGTPYSPGSSSSGGGSFTAPQTYTPGTTTLTNSSNYSVFNCSATSGAVTLPSTSGLSQGWTVIVRFTGTVNSYQALRIAAQSSNAILFAGQSLTNLYTVGRGEAFQIMYLGSQFWITPMIKALLPATNAVGGCMTSNDTSSYTVGGGKTFVGTSVTQNGGFALSSGSLQVPVTGLYNVNLMAYCYANGTSGTYCFIMINGTLYSALPLFGGQMQIDTYDNQFVTATGVIQLNQGDVVTLQAQAYNSQSVTFSPSGSSVTLNFIGR